jgi:hypothetical protein
MVISLSRGILHGYSLWLKLKVSCASLNTTVANPILGVVKMAVEDFLRQGERPVEPLPYLGQIVQK